MGFNDEFMIAYFDEEYRVFGYDPLISNDFADAYICI